MDSSSSDLLRDSDAGAKLLAAAVNAPSGDNSQPWQFRIRDGSLYVYNVPAADETLYNLRQLGSYLAHGALIENIALLASAEGYAADVELFPMAAEPACVARIAFVPSAAEPDPLVEAIPARATNRKPYRREPLRAKDRDALQAAASAPGGLLRLVEGAPALDELAKAVSVNERLIMEHRGLHDFLFGMIRWSRSEERAKPGLYVKTMELPPPVELMFRTVLRSWRALTVLNALGFSRFIPTQSAPVYRASSAFGAIIVAGTEPRDYVLAGRAFERVWLAAVRAGAALQPTTALPYLAARIDKGEADMFSSEHQALIRDAYAPIARAFGLAGRERIAMLFRVGYADAPTATSAKVPPKILG